MANGTQHYTKSTTIYGFANYQYIFLVFTDLLK